MTELTPNPSPLLRVGAFAVRAAFWLVASVWIVLIMVWGALHFVIVPRIAEFRPTLEQQVSRALGVTVRVGDIVARSNGLIPSLELNDVRLLDAQGRETLRLPQVLAALSEDLCEPDDPTTAPPCRRGWTHTPRPRLPRASGSPVQTGMDPVTTAASGCPPWLPRADGDGPVR